MIPVNQFILGSSDPLLYPSEKMTICERYKEVLPNDVEPCDVYVAINAQYHDYAKLFEE